MSDCRVCSGPVEIRDRDARVVQGEGFEGFICGDCMRDGVDAIPTRSFVDSKGVERPIPPRARA